MSRWWAFDDNAIACQPDAPLTTVYQPVEELGREMAWSLGAPITGAPSSSVVLGTRLVRRLSV